MTTSKTESQKRWIRPLPERLINKIAAGEVVERPASVVKELVENSIDSGATRIEIHAEKAGTGLIKITDDGCGISEEQIEIAFSRHATSKITDFQDFDSLQTYGFRGEALPSIASVSHLRMVSRTADSLSGTELIIEGGVVQSKRPIAAAHGTTIEISQLFFNTPARRKFLKTEPTENRHISRIATSLALGNPSVAVTYCVNGKTVFYVPTKQTLAERVSSLLAPGKQLLKLYGEFPIVRVEGMIGYPEQAIGSRSAQYIFVNGRVVSSTTLSHALLSGYGELMPRGNHPVGALLLTVDPTQVDVNVHPAKTEVRLSHEREIHDAIRRCIKETLRQDGIIPVFQPGSSSIDQAPPVDGLSIRGSGDQYAPGQRLSGISERTTSEPALLRQLYQTPVESVNSESGVVQVDTRTGEVFSTPAIVPHAGEGAQSSSTGEDDFRYVGRFADCYLIAQRGDELLLIDQHTAHERILYEEALVRIDREGMLSQQILLPIQVELPPEQFSVFLETKDWLRRSGFIVEEFGGRSVRIEAVPVVLGQKSPERTLLRILDDVASLRKKGFDMKKAMAQTIACRSAVMAGDRLSDQEAVALITSLGKCDNQYSCPHGRPTFVRISRNDLDRQFGRV